MIGCFVTSLFIRSIGIFTDRNSSCGKVMFSLPLGLGLGGVSASWGCTPRQTPPWADTPPQADTHTAPPLPRDSHCSERYASY